MITGIEVATGFAHLLAVHHQVKNAEDIGQLIVAFARQDVGVLLAAKPHSTLHQGVKENIILAEELVDPGLWVFPKLVGEIWISFLFGECDFRERDWSDQGVRPDVKCLARHVGIKLNWKRDAPGHVTRDGSVGPAVNELGMKFFGVQNFPGLQEICLALALNHDFFAGGVFTLVLWEGFLQLFVDWLMSVVKTQ